MKHMMTMKKFEFFGCGYFWVSLFDEKAFGVRADADFMTTL